MTDLLGLAKRTPVMSESLTIPIAGTLLEIFWVSSAAIVIPAVRPNPHVVPDPHSVKCALTRIYWAFLHLEQAFLSPFFYFQHMPEVLVLFIQSTGKNKYDLIELHND